jgi:hypothetical protein
MARTLNCELLESLRHSLFNRARVRPQGRNGNKENRALLATGHSWRYDCATDKVFAAMSTEGRPSERTEHWSLTTHPRSSRIGSIAFGPATNRHGRSCWAAPVIDWRGWPARCSRATPASRGGKKGMTSHRGVKQGRDLLFTTDVPVSLLTEGRLSERTERSCLTTLPRSFS